jgi:Glycoside Hydrolase Family 113
MKKFVRTTIIVYLLTWLGVFLFVVIGVVVNERTLWDGVTTFFNIVPSPSFIKGFHILFLIVYTFFHLIKYFLRVFRKKGYKVFLKRLVLYALLPTIFLVSGYNILVYLNSQEDFAYSWDNSVENKNKISNDHYMADGKHRGMSVFGWNRDNESAISELVRNNVEWVAVIPFFYQKDEQTHSVHVRDTYDGWSRHDSIFIKSIQQLHDKGIHVQLKPHLWMSSGWRSNINLTSRTHWDAWFDSYRINMLHYARMAQETNVELLCIGTELKTSTMQQPEKWHELIVAIKSIYHGKLTYAANWDDEYKDVDFWDQLDYIGIQAYFPLTETKNPDLESIKTGWDKHLTSLEKFSRQHNKPILFTEVGYKSEASSTIKPWEWSSYLSILHKKRSNRTQLLAYEALFQKLWSQEWFAGIYIWQWDIRSTPEYAAKSLNFSPRFKPAENIIAKWYGKR